MKTSQTGLLDYLQKIHGPEIEAQYEKERADRRAALRAEIGEVEGPILKRMQSIQAQREAIDRKVEKIRQECQEMEREANDLSFKFSNEYSAYHDRRDAVWRKLREIPCNELAAFREEVDLRIDNASGLARSWPGPNKDPVAGVRFSVGNHESVQTYVRSLVATKDLIDVAIRTGLDGEAATREIARIRATWPAVQTGPSEASVPPAPTGSGGA